MDVEFFVVVCVAGWRLVFPFLCVFFLVSSFMYIYIIDSYGRLVGVQKDCAFVSCVLVG